MNNETSAINLTQEQIQELRYILEFKIDESISRNDEDEYTDKLRDIVAALNK